MQTSNCLDRFFVADLLHLQHDRTRWSLDSLKVKLFTYGFNIAISVYLLYDLWHCRAGFANPWMSACARSMESFKHDITHRIQVCFLKICHQIECSSLIINCYACCVNDWIYDLACLIALMPRRNVMQCDANYCIRIESWRLLRLRAIQCACSKCIV
jgi:hypothetical protein